MSACLVMENVVLLVLLLSYDFGSLSCKQHLDSVLFSMLSDSINDLFWLYPARMYFLSYLTLPSTDRTSVFFLVISASGERGALL